MKAVLSFFVCALPAGFIVGSLFNWAQGKSAFFTANDAQKHLATGRILTLFFLRSSKASYQ